jgi:hypothetical protein
MSDLRKAAEAALDAFSLFDKALQDPHSDDGWKCLHISNGAAQALRQALAEPANSTTDFVEPKTPVQLEQEPVAWMTDDGFYELEPEGIDAVPLYTAPPKQPEQEAFTLDRGCWERGCMAYDWRDGDGVNISAGRVDETVKHKHEPVAWLSLCYTEDGDPLGYTAHEQEVYGSFPVYTTPPHHASDVKKREWVGLTEEDFENNVSIEIGVNGSVFNSRKFAKQIEHILKEKNHAD